MTTQVQVKAGEVLSNKTVLLSLTMGRLGNTRRVSSAMVEVDAEKDSIHVGKELLKSPELEAIVAYDGVIRRWFYGRTLPSEVLKAGIYRLPISLLEEADAALGSFARARQGLVDQFMGVYSQYVEEAEGRLRALYQKSEYPAAEEVTQAFYFRWRYLMLDVPESISQVSQQMYQRELTKIQQDLSSEAQEIKLALRTGFAEILDHAISRLGSTKDGKKVIFRDSLVENLGQFFRYFQDRNVLDDGEFAGLVERARKVMDGVLPDELRQNDSLRETVRRSFTEVRKVLDDNLMLAPTRRINLDEVGDGE